MVKNGEYSKWVVAIVILINIIFAFGVLVVFWHTSNEPAVLVTAWFGFTTGELWMLSTIKKKKLEGEKDETKTNQP